MFHIRRREFIALLGGRGGRVAARGTLAAAGDAGDRLHRANIT